MRDLHIHSTFSDGKNTPEEIIEKALERGLSEIGFSDHSYTPFDTGYCMSPEGYSEYKNEILRLREKYKGRISILCGIEQDVYSDIMPKGFDYTIGSCHYVKAGNEYLPVDKSIDDLKACVREYFGGDYLAFAEEYFKTVAEIPEKTGADIIGHFDLLTKYNEREPLFDEEHPRYIAAWKKSADALLATGKLFEVNTGVIGRGYKSHPYPAAPILRYLCGKGAGLIFSSDSHRADTVGFEFEKWEEYVKEIPQANERE